MRREPAFWWRTEPSLLAWLLGPLSFAYGAVAAARMTRSAPRLARLPVICIGNFTVGGGGKTPTAITAAKLLLKRGVNPCMLSRGYGGREAGPLNVNAETDTAERVGDEPLLLAEAAPTIVAHDRYAGALAAANGIADVIIMDDGFQSPSLHKDFSIIALDAAVGIGNGMTLPSGPLRAPFEVQFKRADALVMVGEGEPGERIAERFESAGKPVFRARYAPAGRSPWPKKTALLAFAGIARPQKFFATLETLGAPTVMTKAFPDHHVYSESEAADLLELAEEAGARLATTEKDRARLRGLGGSRKALFDAATALPIALRLDEEEAFAQLLTETVGKPTK